jgi:hypothetical protein
MPEEEAPRPIILRKLPSTLALTVVLVHIGYTVFGLAKFRQDKVWPFSPELPWWGSILVILTSVGTAAICAYVAAATPSIPRIIWAAGVVAAAFVVVANAAEGTMLEMATTTLQLWVFALAELLLLVPLFWFSVSVPRPKRQAA